jgi:hypothetical protein
VDGHAVCAPEVAPIRERDAQIVDLTAESVQWHVGIFECPTGEVNKPFERVAGGV